MKSIKFDPNPLCYKMLDIYMQNKDNLFWNEELGRDIKQKVVIYNEGGSRSSKTFDFFHFLYLICDQNRDADLNIIVLRNTLKDCREKTYATDFVSCLKVIGAYDDKMASNVNQAPVYNLFGNKIKFRGIDGEKDSEGYQNDILFINETLDIKEKNEFISGMLMRCEMLAVLDTNPKLKNHWSFDLEGQDNVFFTHTTYRDNKHIKDQPLSTIAGFCPYFEDEIELIGRELYYKGKPLDPVHNHPPYNPKNKKTADYRRYLIYNRGIRGSVEGLIFKKTRLGNDDDVPNWKPVICVDFGFTIDPTTITRYWENEKTKEIITELLYYQPVATPQELDRILLEVGVKKDDYIVADSSDSYNGRNKPSVQMIKDLKKRGWKGIKPIRKTKRISYWVNKMNEYTIVVIKRELQLLPKVNDMFLWEIARKELDNYVWMKIGDEYQEEPDQSCDEHYIDGVRYGFMDKRNKFSLKVSIR